VIGLGINRTYLAISVVLAILVAGLVYYRPSVFAEVSGVPAALQSWWFRRPITVNIYAEMQNPEKIIGVFPRVRLTIPYYPYMNPDFRDVRFEYGYVLPSYWISIENGQKAVVDVELPIAGKGKYTVYMYYGNPVAEMYHVDYPDIGFLWYNMSEMYIVDWFYGVRVPRTRNWGLFVLWVRADGPTYYRVFVTGLGTDTAYIALLRGKWGIHYVNATALDFYSYIYKNYLVANATVYLPAYIDFSIPDSGWYTIVVRYWVIWDGSVAVYMVEDLGSGNKFGNAIDFIQIDDYRARLVPVLWDGNFYSYSIGDAQPVAYVVPMTPTPIWNATIGNAYFEYYVAPRTVTVTVPVTVTVATPVTVTLPPGTVTTTIYIPATTITTWVALPPTTIYRTVTVTVPEFTSSVYTTTVYVPTTITRTVTVPVTTTVPVVTTTTVGGTPTVTTIWVTTTTTTTYYLYTTTTVTSPWIATIITPYTTVTRTITTTIPVTTTIYAAVTIPVYYTTTVTLVNTGTDTVTTTIYVNGTVTGASGSYAAMYPVVIGPYSYETTTTVYWIVKETYTTTVTEYVGGPGYGWGWIVLLAFIAVLGFAIFYLVRRR
jgi:hypothetical protein